MRLIHREALDEIQDSLTVGGSHFLPEMVILARLADIPMLEVPLNYRVRRGESKITGKIGPTIKVGANMIVLILRYRFGPPQLLVVAGAVCGSTAQRDPRRCLVRA